MFRDTQRLLSFLLLVSIQATAQEYTTRPTIRLEGQWVCRIDTAGVGVDQNWQDSTFGEKVNLPGTLESNGKGRYVTKGVTNHLSQTYTYIGAAWFQKEIDIPASWSGKEITLFLERTKVAEVWVDRNRIGKSTLLSAPHTYSIGQLKPGKHRLTIRVDNSPHLVSVGGSHALSEHTQTNWNGIIGRMHLEAAGSLRITSVKTMPDVSDKSVHVTLQLNLPATNDGQIHVELQASSYNSLTHHSPAPVRYNETASNRDTTYAFTLPLGDDALLWSEYTPALYRLSIRLRDGQNNEDTAVTSFGLREFGARGNHFTINGVTTFLRGKNDVCIFPLTGYPPMETSEWQRLYRIAKQYGINHYRFHSYTPPKAAFDAADLEGVYLQPELPNWANFTQQDTFHTDFQRREGIAILDAYGNHPSFVMFSLGNEMTGDTAIFTQLVDDLRSHDNRRLYAWGTNAFYTDPRPGPTDDFWATMRTGKESPSRQFDVRGSFATTEDVGSGIINDSFPSTQRNFSSALTGVGLPVVSHEIGQYQIYPDYTEIPKYTGVLRPLNFVEFQKRLEAGGMGDQAHDFFRASGKLVSLLYREEIEMVLRTPQLAGFQLLDLQDFPGQGTALVGILNAFMENKGLITPEAFRQFNNDVVVQLLMDKYVWTTDETFIGSAQLINYSPHAVTGKRLVWSVSHTARNGEVTSGEMAIEQAPAGQINPIGQITFPFKDIKKPTQLRLVLEIPTTTYRAVYDVWVYPHQTEVRIPCNVTVATTWDDTLIRRLQDGERVVLFPPHEPFEDRTVPPQFISDFWNWQVFKKGAEAAGRPPSAGTLGLLTDPEHPLFETFPTDSHTNWQWWSITKNARPFILDATPADYRPIVQVIDNIDRNHKLGMIFEFRVGNGRLLVCMADLPNMLHRPEARQLYRSILGYVSSSAFKPQTSLSKIQSNQLFTSHKHEN